MHLRYRRKGDESPLALSDCGQAAILHNHSYEVAEIVQLPIERGLDRYLDWVQQNTAPE